MHTQCMSLQVPYMSYMRNILLQERARFVDFTCKFDGTDFEQEHLLICFQNLHDENESCYRKYYAINQCGK